MMQTDSPWCPHPFKYLMISPAGFVKPCCRFQSGQESLTWGTEINPISHFKGEGFNSIRRKMSAGQTVEGCQKCDLEDKSGLVSMRRRVIRGGEFTLNDQVEIEGLEIGFSRKCNLRCRSCNGQFSTKWELDEKKLGINSSYSSKEISLSDFSDQDLSALKNLKVTGGEPFLSPSFFDFIEYLDQKNLLKNIDCEIFTNCTVSPKPKFLEKLSRFKTLKIGLSVDAFDEKNTYIRNPSKWDDIVKNAQLWDLFCFGSHHLQVSLAITVTIYNVIYLFELLSWWREHFPQRNFFLQIAAEPTFLSIYDLKPEESDQMCDIYNLEKMSFLEKHSLSPQEKEHIDWIEMALKKVDSQSNKTQIFLKETRIIDQLRGESFADTFPALSFVLNKAL